MNLKFPLIAAGVAAVFLLGIMATWVGNIGIRRIQPNEDVKLLVNEPVVPGVETTIRWTADSDVPNQNVEFRLRLPGQELPLGAAEFSDKSANVVFPCASQLSTGTVSMLYANTGELISWVQIKMLPPGPDCLR